MFVGRFKQIKIIKNSTSFPNFRLSSEAGWGFKAEAYLNHYQHLRFSSFAKIVKYFYPFTIFAKKLHSRCSTGFKIDLWKDLRNTSEK